MSVSATLLHGLLQVINSDTLVPPPPFLLVFKTPSSLNSLPSIDPFNLPLSSVISHIKTYFWSHFIDHFNPSHFTSPVHALSIFTPSLKPSSQWVAEFSDATLATRQIVHNIYVATRMLRDAVKRMFFFSAAWRDARIEPGSISCGASRHSHCDSLWTRLYSPNFTPAV